MTTLLYTKTEWLPQTKLCTFSHYRNVQRIHLLKDFLDVTWVKCVFSQVRLKSAGMVNKIPDFKIRNYCLITYTVVTSFPVNLLIFLYANIYVAHTHTHKSSQYLKLPNSVFRNCIDLFFKLYCYTQDLYISQSLGIFWLGLDDGFKP